MQVAFEQFKKPKPVVASSGQQQLVVKPKLVLKKPVVAPQSDVTKVKMGRPRVHADHAMTAAERKRRQRAKQNDQ